MSHVLKAMRAMWQEIVDPGPATSKHYDFIERFGMPPGRGSVECRGLDVRGLPKFKVKAGRRSTT